MFVDFGLRSKQKTCANDGPSVAAKHPLEKWSRAASSTTTKLQNECSIRYSQPLFLADHSWTNGSLPCYPSLPPYKSISQFINIFHGVT